MIEKVDDKTGEIEHTACELNGDATVQERWLWVQANLPGIPKGSVNKQQGFKYRSIDDVLEIVHDLFAKAGVFVLPARQEAQHTEWQGASGKSVHVTRIKVDWQIYGAKGDWITGQTQGEAADAFDKATSKAQTAAFKYLLWPALTVNGNEDGDGQTPESTVPRGTLEAVAEGGAAVQEKFRKMDAPTGAKMATQKQVNLVRIKARDIGIAAEGSEVVKVVESLGEPGWPESGQLIDLEGWQISQLIDHLKKEAGDL